MCFKKKLTEPVIFAKKTKKQRLGENAKKGILNTMHLKKGYTHCGLCNH